VRGIRLFFRFVQVIPTSLIFLNVKKVYFCMFVKKRVLFLIFLLSVVWLYAQNNGSVKGFVYDKANGEPVPFSNVFLKGTTIGSGTDLNGFFILTKIPAGKYTLVVSNLEYDTIREPIEIQNGTVLNKKFFATKGGISLQEVEVEATTTEKVENTTVATQKIDPVVINKLPSVGEPDIAQYLQVLPGVVFTGDQGGQLYIRGGLPVQNKVLLDGLIVYNPFHSIGLFSVFDTDVMKNADVYSAGFGAEYGGRTSSVMDVTTRDGNKKRMSGKLALSTFGAKFNIEGPLKKMKEDGQWSSSYIFSAKHSYLPQTSKVLYNYAREGGLPFYYTDVYGKVSINSTTGSKISLFGFNFNDKVDYSGFKSYKWNNMGVGANFVLVPQNSNLLGEGVFAYSKYKIDYTNPSLITDSKSSEISGVNTGFNFVRFIRKQELRFGFEGVITNTTYKVQNPSYAVINLTRSTMDVATYMKYKYVDRKTKLIFEPGFRLQYYATLGVLSPEPRLAFKYNLTKKFRIKAAGGLYSQTLMAANSDRDVVNLFYGFINAPESNDISKTYLDRNGKSQSVNSSVQKGRHAVAGVEFDLFKHLDVNIEAYEKFFDQVININRDKIYDDNSTNAFRPDEEKKTFVIEQGRARGLDFVLKYDRKRYYFWAVYSLTFNDRWVGNSSTKTVLNYPPNYDRRHNVNLLASYVFGKHKNWEVNARWNFGTGFPFTQTQGYYNQINPQGNINFQYQNANGTLSYIPGTLNGGRLPDFHRLDISMKFNYKWSEKTLLEVNLGVTNVYNRKNIFQVDRFTFARENQLPIMPNLTMSATF